MTPARCHGEPSDEKPGRTGRNARPGKIQEFKQMVDIPPRDAPQLCPCGRAPLQCAVATLASVRASIGTGPRSWRAFGPDDPLITAECIRARNSAIEACTCVHEILSRDGGGGRSASRGVETAAFAVEAFISADGRRRRRETELLRRRFGKEVCPARDDKSDLRKAVEQLRWCRSSLDQAQRGSND